MARQWAAILTCLLATSVQSSELNTGHEDDVSEDGYGPSTHFRSGPTDVGNNDWTPSVGPGPSSSDVVYQDRTGAKTLVAGSPTSPIAEAINYQGAPPPLRPPPHLTPPPHLRPPVRTTYQHGYRYGPPAPPVSYAVETNHIHNHHESYNVPTKILTNTIQVPVPQPYKVLIDKKVPYEVKVPVHEHVPRPVQVPVPRPVHVPVDKPYEVIVERKVPYEVRVPVQVPVHVPYRVEVPQPYPVPVDVPKPIIIKHPVPVVIKIIKSGKRGLFG